MWEAILDWIFQLTAWFQSFIGDWGMAIIIITIIFRLILLPITFKQTKSTYMMQKLQPKISEVQKLYANDQQKQSEELQRLYREAHYNPLTGCIPVLLQMPIFIALFQVLRSISERVEPGTILAFYGLVPNLSYSPMDALQISVVYSIPYFILVAIFGLSVLIPVLLQKNQQQQNSAKIMMIIMAIFMVYIGCQSPGGVLLFWDVSSIIGIAVQQALQHYYKKKDAVVEAVEVKPVKVNVVRKEKKARPKKKR